ncbi:MAG: DUF6259 domain-containing protein [Armatimonadota bacterium]
MRFVSRLLLCLLIFIPLFAFADEPAPEQFPAKVNVGDVMLFKTSEGTLERVEVDDRVGYTLLGMGSLIYGDVLKGKSAHLRLEIELHDGGYKGNINVPYDSGDDTVLAEARYPGAWKGSSIKLEGKDAWTTVTLEWTDARLAKRCNGHDFRLHLPANRQVVIGAIRVVELPPVPPPVRPVRMPLSTVKSEGVVADGDVVRLPGAFTQEDDTDIVMNAADATTLQMTAGKTPGAEGNPAGKRYIHFVQQATYRFAVKTPGIYQLWERAWFPVKGSWNHHEHVDGKQSFMVIDSPNTLEANRWHWVKAGRYTLAVGTHEFSLDYHGGARLDRLVFSPNGDEPPAQDGGAPSRNVGPAKGLIETADATPMDVAQWLAWQGDLDARGGTLTVELSADGGANWFPAPADRALNDVKVAGSGKDRLRARLTFARAMDGASPIAQGLAASYLPGANDQMVLSNGEMAIAFGPVGVRRLDAEKLGAQFLFGGIEAPLFQLLLKPKGSASPFWVPSTAAAVTGREINGDTLQQRFRFANGITVACTTALTGADSRWGIEIQNGSTLEVTAVQYPMFQGVRVGADCADDTLLIPSVWKQLVRNPVGWNSQPIRELAMHWTYLYDEKAGLYLGDHNWPMHDLVIFPTRNDPSSLNYGFTREYLVAPGATVNAAETVVAARPGGSWHAGADIYRVAMSGRILPPPNPAWTRRMDGWYTGPSNDYPHAGYSAIAATHDRALERGLGYYLGGNRAQIDGPMEYVGMWPTYCPAYGSLQEFKDVLREVRENGGHSNWYFNWQLLSPSRVVGRTRIAGLIPRTWVEHPVTWFTKEDYQKTALRWYAWGEAQLGTDNDELVQCVGSSAWQRHHAERTADWVKLYGADGMYYDQLSCVNNLCGSLEHGHADYGVWGLSTATDLGRITTEMRKTNPHFVSSGEGCNDLIGQAVTFHMTSGVWNRLEIFRYCFSEQLLLDGGWNSGAWQGDNRFRYIWMTGARFEGLPDNPYCNQLQNLRRKVSQLIYPARFMDTVGLELKSGGQVSANPPKMTDSGVEIAPVQGPQAKWFLLSAPSRGAIINVIQDLPADSNEAIIPPITVSVPTAEFGTVKVAWMLYLDGKVERLQGQEKDGRYIVDVPGASAGTVLLVNQVGPQIVNLNLPFSAAPGAKMAGTATFTHYGTAPATVNLRWAAPAGWTGAAEAVHLQPGETKSAHVSLALPANAAPNRYDLTLITEADGAKGEYPHWVTATTALWVRLVREANGPVTATVFNRSDKPLTGTLTFTAPKGVLVDKPTQPFTVPAWGKAALTVTVRGLEPLQAPVHLLAIATAGKETTKRSLMLYPPAPNGQFDADSAGDNHPDYWFVWGTGDERKFNNLASLDTEAPCLGRSSLKLNPHPEPGKQLWVNPIVSTLDVGKKYRVSVAIRTTSENDKPFVQVGPLRLTGGAPGKWTLLQGVFTCTSNNAHIQLCNTGQNPVWFDALTIEPVE